MDYFLIYKPFQVLSQFTSIEGKLCLKDILHVPNDVYPVGRLDYDSEGLLLITNDKTIISILEIQGLKFTSRNFQIEIELKQSMIVNPDPFLDECFIKTSKKIKEEK